MTALSSPSVEERGDLLAGDGAAVPDLAGLDVLDLLSELGGGGELELGVGDGGVLVEEGEDDVVLALGHLSGGQVADQAADALLGLGAGDEGEGVHLGVGGAAAAAAAGEGAEGESLEGDGSDGEEGGASGADADGGGAGGGGGGSDGDATVEEDGLGHAAHGGEGSNNGGLGVHAEK